MQLSVRLGNPEMPTYTIGRYSHRSGETNHRCSMTSQGKRTGEMHEARRSDSLELDSPNCFFAGRLDEQLRTVSQRRLEHLS